MFKRNHIGSTSMMVIGIIMMIIAAAVMYFAKARLDSEKRCISTTDAVITSVDKIRKTKKENGKERTTYKYRTDYKYEVGEDTYSGYIIFNEGFSKKVGNTIKVNYNPDDPKEHYCQSSHRGMSLVIMAVLIAVVALVIIIDNATSNIRVHRRIAKIRKEQRLRNQ